MSVMSPSRRRLPFRGDLSKRRPVPLVRHTQTLENQGAVAAAKACGSRQLMGRGSAESGQNLLEKHRRRGHHAVPPPPRSSRVISRRNLDSALLRRCVPVSRISARSSQSAPTTATTAFAPAPNVRATRSVRTSTSLTPRPARPRDGRRASRRRTPLQSPPGPPARESSEARARAVEARPISAPWPGRSAR